MRNYTPLWYKRLVPLPIAFAMTCVGMQGDLHSYCRNTIDFAGGPDQLSLPKTPIRPKAPSLVRWGHFLWAKKKDPNAVP
jgi:hypothetical protein